MSRATTSLNKSVDGLFVTYRVVDLSTGPPTRHTDTHIHTPTIALGENVPKNEKTYENTIRCSSSKN